MRTINFSDARTRLKQVFDQVVADADVAVITRRDAQDVVVMSLETWNSWQETNYLLSSPVNALHLAKSIAQLDAGRGKSRDLLSPVKGQLQVAEPTTKYKVTRLAKRKLESVSPIKRNARK